MAVWRIENWPKLIYSKQVYYTLYKMYLAIFFTRKGEKFPPNWYNWYNFISLQNLLPFHLCTPQYTVQNRKLPPSFSGSSLCLLNSVIVFVKKSPTRPLFEKKPNIFSLFILFFFFTFQDENSQKERYIERRYKFYFFFLFGNFLLKCENNNEREKWFVFPKREGGIGLCSYKPP